MEDLDYNYQNQPHFTSVSANKTVAQLADAEKIADQTLDNRFHTINDRVWTDEEKKRVVEIDREERLKGKNFMKRIKERWHGEYPEKRRTAQNLIDNAKRFAKEGWGSLQENVVSRQAGEMSSQSHVIEWTTEMKVRLVQIDNEERRRGRGFMKRVKDRWIEEYPEYAAASMQKLRDNASRFRKEQTITNLILVRQESNLENDSWETQAGEQQRAISGHGQHDETYVECDEAVEDSDDFVDKELMSIFNDQLQSLTSSTLTAINPREKLKKLKVPVELQKKADGVLRLSLRGVDTIPEITDKVYAMGRALEIKMGLPQTAKSTIGRQKPGTGNRRVRKLKQEMKRLRQVIARAGNELQRRKLKRKATAKEKMILKDLKHLMNESDTTSTNIRRAKEKWLDQLRYKKVKLEKMIERGNRIRDNANFERDQKGFFKSLERIDYEGKPPPMERFEDFWAGIWEKDEKTPEMPWMEKVQMEMKDRVQVVNEFTITNDNVAIEIKKRKNWTAPGIDGIQNYWWKKFQAAQSALTRAFVKLTNDNELIPVWWPAGRTVQIPKTKDLSNEQNYRPITCLSTSYKILTGLIGRYMRQHALENSIWDEGQLGAVAGVLGTVDQLLIDKCIMEEVKAYHRNLAVAYYDYKKAYDKVHHDWMIRVYEWIGIPAVIISVLKALMNKWKTRLELWKDGEKCVSRWIDIKCGFLQGDSYSPVGFCITEIPIAKLLEQSKGYRMGEPGMRNVNRTHSFFVDDLKVYQESHDLLKEINEIIVQASFDTGACYGVSKCAEIVFERGKMIKGEGLQVLQERMKALDPTQDEMYRFLGVEQSNGIKAKNVYKRVKEEVTSRMRVLLTSELNDENLIQAINSKVIPVAAYPMNVCKMTKNELNELDQVIKRELRMKHMLGKQASDERLYLKRDQGGRGLQSMRDVYAETRTRVACYMCKSSNKWIQAAWRRENKKESNAIIDEAVNSMMDIDRDFEFVGNNVRLMGEVLELDWKATWKRVKQELKRGTQLKRKENYRQKELQSDIYGKQEQECHLWLKQRLTPRKTSSIMILMEQMVETRGWKMVRGLIENGRCRLCGDFNETLEHLVAGCKVMANSEYLARHNRALMVMAIAWAKEYGLVAREVVWYKENWTRGKVLENANSKLIWDFEFNLRKTTTSRRPDLILEDKEKSKIWICDMACPQQANIVAKRHEKLTKYRQLAFELRERRLGYDVEIVPVVIGALGGGIKQVLCDVERVFSKHPEKERLAKATVAEMQKTVLMDSESMVRRVLSGLLQADE